MSVGMFSILPVPKNSWDERCLPWIIPWMPVVGGLIGIVWYAVARGTVDLPLPIRSAVVLLTPFVLSGFLHLDGYMDTADAYFARRDLEEKRRILKDSHVGAFAVIALACLLLLQFCIVETMLAEKKSLIAFVFIPILSRCAAGLMLLHLKPMSASGFAAQFKRNVGKRHVLFLGAFLSIALAGALSSRGSVFLASAVVLFTGGSAMLYLANQFQGVSGDLCGCAITLSELSGLLAVSLI